MRVLVIALGLTIAGGGALAQTSDQQDFSLIQVGKYLTDLGDCFACHTAEGGKPFAGGRPIETPFGNIVSPNITPDDATGIGGWSDEKFDRAVRSGISGDENLYPAMPYPYYTKMSREDVLAIRAYLRTLDPVSNRIHSNELPFPFSVRASMIGWNAMFFRGGEWRNHADKSAEWNRGGYLVEGAGHCGACHTPKNLLGGDEDSQHLQGYPLQGWFAPDITSDARIGIGGWPVEAIVEYLKTGANAYAQASGPMAEVVADSTSHLNLPDLRAIAVYLKDQPATAESQAKAPAKDESRLRVGEAIYADQCAACHTASGGGIARLFPPLKGSATVQSPHPDTLLHVILNGTRAVATKEAPTGPAMPSFGWKLSDEQVADLASYIRTAWGNAAESISSSDVHDMRQAIAARQ